MAGVVPGNPTKSQVYQQITPHEGQEPAMPRGKEPLSDREVDDHQEMDRAGGEGRHAGVGEVAGRRCGASAGLSAAAGDHGLGVQPDGKLLAVTGYHEVLLHKADGTGLVARLVGLSERMQSVAFSPDGKWLAVTGGSPGRFGEVQIWDVAKRKLKLSRAGHLRHGLRRQLVARRQADRLRLRRQHAAGHRRRHRQAGPLPGRPQRLGARHRLLAQGATYLVSVSRDRSMKLTEVATQRFVDNITSITPGASRAAWRRSIAIRPRTSC